MIRTPSRATSGTNRWGSIPARGRMKRPCPKCGAKPHSSCFTIKTLKVTGQDLSLPDPSYPVRLKIPHRER
jgi:hypothetical protein